MNISNLPQVTALVKEGSELVRKITGIEKFMAKEEIETEHHLNITFYANYMQTAKITIDDQHVEMYARMTEAKLRNELKDIVHQLKILGVEVPEESMKETTFADLLGKK